MLQQHFSQSLRFWYLPACSPLSEIQSQYLSRFLTEFLSLSQEKFSETFFKKSILRTALSLAGSAKVWPLVLKLVDLRNPSRGDIRWLARMARSTGDRNLFQHLLQQSENFEFGDDKIFFRNIIVSEWLSSSCLQEKDISEWFDLEQDEGIPLYPDVLILAGNSLFTRNKLQAARNYYFRALQIWKDHFLSCPGRWECFHLIYHKANLLPDLIEGKALAETPELLEAWLNLPLWSDEPEQLQTCNQSLLQLLKTRDQVILFDSLLQKLLQRSESSQQGSKESIHSLIRILARGNESQAEQSLQLFRGIESGYSKDALLKALSEDGMESSRRAYEAELFEYAIQDFTHRTQEWGALLPALCRLTAIFPEREEEWNLLHRKLLEQPPLLAASLFSQWAVACEQARNDGKAAVLMELAYQKLISFKQVDEMSPREYMDSRSEEMLIRFYSLQGAETKVELILAKLKEVFSGNIPILKLLCKRFAWTLTNHHEDAVKLNTIKRAIEEWQSNDDELSMKQIAPRLGPDLAPMMWGAVLNGRFEIIADILKSFSGTDTDLEELYWALLSGMMRNRPYG